MEKDILLILSDAIQHEQDRRPCEMYRAVVCPRCPSQKQCNDLDVIMCGMAFLIGPFIEKNK